MSFHQVWKKEMRWHKGSVNGMQGIQDGRLDFSCASLRKSMNMWASKTVQNSTYQYKCTVTCLVIFDKQKILSFAYLAIKNVHLYLWASSASWLIGILVTVGPVKLWMSQAVFGASLCHFGHVESTSLPESTNAQTGANMIQAWVTATKRHQPARHQKNRLSSRNLTKKICDVQHLHHPGAMIQISLSMRSMKTCFKERNLKSIYIGLGLWDFQGMHHKIGPIWNTAWGFTFECLSKLARTPDTSFGDVKFTPRKCHDEMILAKPLASVAKVHGQFICFTKWFVLHVAMFLL